MQPQIATDGGGAQLTGADGRRSARAPSNSCGIVAGRLGAGLGPRDARPRRGGPAGRPAHLSIARQGDGEDRSARQRRPGEGGADGGPLARNADGRRRPHLTAARSVLSIRLRERRGDQARSGVTGSSASGARPAEAVSTPGREANTRSAVGERRRLRAQRKRRLVKRLAGAGALLVLRCARPDRASRTTIPRPQKNWARPSTSRREGRLLEATRTR